MTYIGIDPGKNGAIPAAECIALIERTDQVKNIKAQTQKISSLILRGIIETNAVLRFGKHFGFLLRKKRCA